MEIWFIVVQVRKFNWKKWPDYADPYISVSSNSSNSRHKSNANNVIFNNLSKFFLDINIQQKKYLTWMICSLTSMNQNKINLKERLS